MVNAAESQDDDTVVIGSIRMPRAESDALDEFVEQANAADPLRPISRNSVIRQFISRGIADATRKKRGK